MKIDFFLKENINGTQYQVRITSPDGQSFTVEENDKKTVEYQTREEFLSDFGELESWFFDE